MFIIYGRKTSLKLNLKLVSKALQKDSKLKTAMLTFKEEKNLQKL